MLNALRISTLLLTIFSIFVVAGMVAYDFDLIHHNFIGWSFTACFGVAASYYVYSKDIRDL